MEEKEAPLSAAQRSRIRRLSQPKEHDPSEAGGELNIVPFLDIVMNVLMFVLATIPAVFTATIDVEPPSSGGAGRVRAAEKPTLNLTMLIASGGVSLKTGSFSIGPNCEAGGAGYTVTAASDGTVNWDEIKACAKKLKDASPDYKEENSISIVAEPGTPYATIIKAMDAVRYSGEDLLFDNVNFGVPRLPMTQGPAAPRPPVPPRASTVRFKTALRKAIRKNAKEPDIDFLNITAMLDMMTIILVFLLKNMSASNAAPPQSDDLKLPPSVVSTPPKEEGVALFITKSQILVGDNPDPVVILPDRAQLASTGLDARFKRDGINGLYITPLGNALQVVRDQDKQINAAKGNPDAKSEAIIIADKDTPDRKSVV